MELLIAAIGVLLVALIGLVAVWGLWRRARVASARLRAWDREVLTRTEMPVGKWRRVTVVETLLTCWPPGPLDRQKTSSTSLGRHGRIPRPSRRTGWETSPGIAPRGLWLPGTPLDRGSSSKPARKPGLV